MVGPKISTVSSSAAEDIRDQRKPMSNALLWRPAFPGLISRTRSAPPNRCIFFPAFFLSTATHFLIAFEIYFYRYTYLDHSPLETLQWICAPKGFLGLYFQIIFCHVSVPTRWRGKLLGNWSTYLFEQPTEEWPRNGNKRKKFPTLQPQWY